MIELVRKTHATTVFFERLVSPRIADTVARATGAKTAVLDPIEGLTQDEARHGADRSCGSIAVTRPRSLKMRARIRCSRLGPGRGTRMARFRKRRISLTVL